MIFNFSIDVGNGTEYGLVTANSIEEAEDFVLLTYDCETYANFDIQPGAEDLINQQYGGLALLTTGL